MSELEPRRFRRLRELAALLIIRINLTITYLYAAAASAVGTDVLLSLLGVGAGWPPRSPSSPLWYCSL